MRTSPLSSVEYLETRIAPASVFADTSGVPVPVPNTTAELINGVLVIEPDDPTAPLDLVVRQTGVNSFELVDQGHLFDTFMDVASLRIRGGAAEDSIVLDFLDSALTRFNGVVRVQAGQGGADEVRMVPGQLATDLRVTLGAGAKYVSEPGSSVLGTLLVKSTAANTMANLSGGAADVVLNGVQTVEFAIFVSSGNTVVTGSSTIALNVTATQPATFGGSFQVNHPGAQTSAVTFINAGMDGPVKLRLGDGDNSVSMDAPIFSHAVRVRGGSGADTIVANDADLFGGITFGLGGGANVVSIEGNSNVHNALTLRGGGVGSVTTLEIISSVIRGRVTMLVPLGDANFLQSTSRVLGGIDLVNGAGDLGFLVDASGDSRGAINIQAGGGENAAEIQTLSILRGFNYTGGSGVDSVILGSPGGLSLRATVNLGGGNDSMRVEGVNLASLTLDGGSGTDTFTRPATLTSPLVATIRIENLVTL